MSEVLLIRHAQSRANQGDFVTFDNLSSPLTEKGLMQCDDLRVRLACEYGIDPFVYGDSVASSEFVRTQQTAQVVGFRQIDPVPILNEPDFSRGTMTGSQIVHKHQRERWAPKEARAQARQLIDSLETGKFTYLVAFSHGMFTATVLLELEETGHDMSSYTFDPERGYVPLQTGITMLAI